MLRRLVSNTIWMMLAQLCTWSFTLALTVVLPRHLGAAEFGRLYFGIAFTNISAIFVSMGIDWLVAREVGRDRTTAARYLSVAMAAKAGFWVLTSGLSVGVLIWLGLPDKTVAVVAILSGLVLFQSITLLTTALFRAFERMAPEAMGQVIEKGLAAGAGIAVVLLGGDVLLVAAAMLGAAVAHMIWNLAFLRQQVPIRFSIDPALARPLVIASFPFFAYAALRVFYYQVDATMLAIMTDDTVVGWYGAAYRLFDTLVFVPYIFTSLIFPMLSRLSVESEEGLRRVVNRSLGFLVLIAVPISVAAVVLAPAVISLLYGPEFTASVPVLQIFGAGLSLLYVDFLIGTVLMSTNRQGPWTLAAGIAAVVNPLLNLWAISHYQHLGAAAATLVTEALIMVLGLSFLPRGLLEARVLVLAGRAALAGGAMAVAMLAVGPQTLPVAAAAGGSVYLLASWALGAINRDDLRLLRAAFQARADRQGAVA